LANDLDGNTGEVVVDKEKHTITIKAKIIFYGDITAKEA